MTRSVKRKSRSPLPSTSETLACRTPPNVWGCLRWANTWKSEQQGPRSFRHKEMWQSGTSASLTSVLHSPAPVHAGICQRVSFSEDSFFSCYCTSFFHKEQVSANGFIAHPHHCNFGNSRRVGGKNIQSVASHSSPPQALSKIFLTV